jgi:hypothetical protein
MNSSDGEGELFRIGREILGRQQVHERSGKHDPEQHENAGDDDQGADHIGGHAPCGVLAARRQVVRERRHERRAHRPFSKQVAEQIGNAEGDVVGVHRDVVRRSEQRGKDLLADQSEDAAGHGGSAGRCRGARQMSG